MQLINNIYKIREQLTMLFPIKYVLKSISVGTIILGCSFSQVNAQVSEFNKPSWYFGAAAGANFNFYRGTTQVINDDLTVPEAFHNGFGIGLFAAPTIEYYAPGTMLGFMLQAGYDNRQAKFDRVISPCNCPVDLSTDMSYFTVEPSLRFAPFRSNFYLFGGPRFAFNLTNGFTYKMGKNPDYPNQEPIPDVNGEFSKTDPMQISMQIGAGVDIPLSAPGNRAQLVLSPFVSYHPYFGQSPRTVESWNITTVRAGLALKIGWGSAILPASDTKVPVKIPDVDFSVHSPENVPEARRVRETFPVRNYVYFNLGSTEIPDRYVLLKKDQVKDFKEDQLEVFTPKSLTGRSKRQMVVYYNVLNILGDRMGKNPSVNIKLVGSSEKGPDDAKLMAESVKKYLVDVFGISPARIAVEGLSKPKIPSEQIGGTQELVLLREGDRRVSIESNSPAILMEFQSGPDAPLKPVEIVGVQEAPIDSYIAFDVKGAKKAFESWRLEVTDEKGKVQNFGPYTQEKVTIPGKEILGTRPVGDFKVKMIGKTKAGTEVIKETDVHMVLWTPPQNEEGQRYSVIYEFNDSKAIKAYEKYLTEIVTPKIPKNGTVIIHGHTDVIGDDTHNQALSTARANDVKIIIQNALDKAGRSDVKFEVYGFGEDAGTSPFDNNSPEERAYNRMVVIDILPAKQ